MKELPLRTNGLPDRRFRHGARSRRVVADVLPTAAAEIRRRIGTLEAWWITEADGLTIELAAKTIAELDQMERYFAAHGVLDGRGRPRNALKMYIGLKNTALRQLNALGLTPAARAQLRADEGSAQRDLARAMRQEPPGPADGADETD